MVESVMVEVAVELSGERKWGKRKEGRERNGRR